MTPRRLLAWSVIALVTGAALFVLEALVGLNFVPEGDPLPWFLRVLQGLAIALVVASSVSASWAMLVVLRRARR